MATYKRDKRSPIPKNESVSKVMSANKAKDTKPELALRKALWGNGLRGYRLNAKSLPGKPDIAYLSRKFAIFVNGCYWHKCPHCDLPLPKHNTDFWKNKFDKNRERDLKKTRSLEELGWDVLTVWECQIKSDIGQIITQIEDKLNDR